MKIDRVDKKGALREDAMLQSLIAMVGSRKVLGCKSRAMQDDQDQSWEEEEVLGRRENQLDQSK